MGDMADYYFDLCWPDEYDDEQEEPDDDFAPRPRHHRQSSRRSNIDYTTWTTSSGTKVPLTELDPLHLDRIIDRVRTKWKPTGTRNHWLKVLKQERDRREVAARAKQAQADPMYAAFAAGWEAHFRYSEHDWGPGPPNNPVSAFLAWKGEKGGNDEGGK